MEKWEMSVGIQSEGLDSGANVIADPIQSSRRQRLSLTIPTGTARLALFHFE